MEKQLKAKDKVALVVSTLTNPALFSDFETWDVESNDRDAVAVLAKALGEYFVAVKEVDGGKLVGAQRDGLVITTTMTLLSLSALTYEGRYGSGFVFEVMNAFVAAKEKHGDMTLETDSHSVATAMAAIGEEYGEWCRALTYDEGRIEDAAEELAQFAGLVAAFSVRLLGNDGLEALM